MECFLFYFISTTVSPPFSSPISFPHLPSTAPPSTPSPSRKVWFVISVLEHKLSTLTESKRHSKFKGRSPIGYLIQDDKRKAEPWNILKRSETSLPPGKLVSPENNSVRALGVPEPDQIHWVPPNFYSTYVRTISDHHRYIAMPKMRFRPEKTTSKKQAAVKLPERRSEFHKVVKGFQFSMLWKLSSTHELSSMLGWFLVL